MDRVHKLDPVPFYCLLTISNERSLKWYINNRSKTANLFTYIRLTLVCIHVSYLIRLLSAVNMRKHVVHTEIYTWQNSVAVMLECDT